MNGSNHAGRVAIIGAGVAGLGAAHALRATGASVVIFEASASIGGRATTRRRAGCLYDLGANYIKSPDDRTDRLIREQLRAGGLIDIAAPVWIFDSAGEIRPGNDTDDHKWNYRRGLAQLSRTLLAGSGARLVRETAIRRCLPTRGGWWLVDERGADQGQWEMVLLTPPAPQSAAVLAGAADANGPIGRLVTALEGVPYRPVLSIALHYPFPTHRPYYALVNVDRRHPIGWLSRESCKPGHVPDGETLLVAQMSPAWSRANRRQPVDANGERVAQMVAALLGERRLEQPDWWDQQYWQHALPDGAVEPPLLEAVEPLGLFIAGDGVVGQGRVHRALYSGLAAGARIATRLG